MNRKRKWFIILLFSIIICFGAAIWAFFTVKKLPRYDYSIDDWKSEHALYKNNGFTIDDEVKSSEKSIIFLWGPYKPLKKGSYTANISYSAENDQSCIATAAGGYAEVFISSEGILSKYLNDVSYQFEISDDVPEFQLVIRYSGKGDFTVNSISISPNSSQVKRIAVEVIAFVFLLDCVILFLEQSEEKKKVILALAGITTLISLPLWIYGIHNGYDLGVHYLRIEAIVQALRSGQFPARISSITLYGLGYPFSIYYNDLFLYFPAVLRLLGFSVTSAYKFYVFAINLLTVLISFYSLGKIFKSRQTGLILTSIYATASYRLLNVYIRAAVGEYTAQAFLPLLALAVYRIYSDKNDGSFRDIFRNALLLSFAISGIIGSHILTTLMVCFVLLVFCVLLWKKTLRKQTMLTLFFSIGLSVLMNAYFLVPFMDYYFNVPTQISESIESDIRLIQGEGVYPAQFFAFFQDIHGGDSIRINDRMQLTPGLLLMVMLVYAFIVRFNGKDGSRKTNKTMDLLLFFSVLMLFISSNRFPWDWLAIHFRPWNILTQIQYPCRFLVLAILFLTLLAGTVLKGENGLFIKSAVVVTAVMMTFWFISSLFDNSNITAIYDTSGVSPEWTCCEQYMLAGSSKDKLTSEARGINMDNVEVLSRDSNTVEMTCKSGQNSEPHVVDSPVYHYPGYHVVDMEGNEYPIFSGEENHIRFILPDDFDGLITVKFDDPFYWRISLWVSLAAVLVSVFFMFWNKKKVLTCGGKCEQDQ